MGKIHNPRDKQIALAASERPRIKRHQRDFGALDYKYGHPDDFVYWSTVLPILDQYNEQDLHHLVDPLDLGALTIAPTGMRGWETKPAVYVLQRHEMWAKVQLKVVWEVNADWDAGVVLLRNGENWVPLTEWLPTLPKTRLPDLDAAALELQYQSWSKSGKSFRFLDLPAELQRRIFLFALGEYIRPDHFCGFTMLTGDTSFDTVVDVQYRVPALPPRPAPVNLALLRLSKATRQTARDVLWNDTIKRYDSWYGLDGIPESVPARYWRCMRHVQLATSHWDFFRIFRPPIRPFDNYTWEDGNAPALILTKLPLLHSVELCFMSTVETSYTPWVYYETPNYIERTLVYGDIDFGRLPCQKVLVDWIMRFAAEFLRGVRSVAVTGFVKTETKEKWERMLNCKGPNNYVGEIERMKREVMALPDKAL